MYKLLLIFTIPIYTLDGLRTFIEKAREVAKAYSSVSATQISAWTELANVLEQALSNYGSKPPTVAEVTSVFEQLVGAVSFGGTFRDALRQDQEAFAAARFLISRLRIQRVPGLEAPSSTTKPSIPPGPPTPKSSK